MIDRAPIRADHVAAWRRDPDWHAGLRRRSRNFSSPATWSKMTKQEIAAAPIDLADPSHPVR